MNQPHHYEAPRSLAEAAAVLARGDVTILAGGTDLMVQAEAGRVRLGGTLMSIRRVAELRGVERDGDAIRIGALTTVTELMRDERIHSQLPVLAEACDCFASPQIRNAATLGGNISNASPAGDTILPLLALDAEVTLARAEDGALRSRALALKDYFTGPGKTRREAGELLVAVRVPLPAPGFVARFEKFGTRPALDVAAVAMAVGGVRAGGALHRVRVAFGAVAPVPMRAVRTEAALEGKALDEASVLAAARVAREEVAPIDDVRASAWYRRELIQNLTARVLRQLAEP